MGDAMSHDPPRLRCPWQDVNTYNLLFNMYTNYLLVASFGDISASYPPLPCLEAVSGKAPISTALQGNLINYITQAYVSCGKN
jgi:hypothetical protein